MHRPLSSTPSPSRHHVRRLRAALAAGAILAVALTACGQESTDASGSVVVSDSWVRATEGAEDTSMTAAFMAIDNNTDADVALVGAASPVAGSVELHEMVMVDGAMAMQEVAEDGIGITAGRGRLLEPGGYHIMLMDLTEPLAAGDEIALTLDFSDNSTQELTVPVKAFTEEEGHYHEPGTGSHSHDENGEVAER